MAKKEYVKLTPESLHLATVLHYNNISAYNSFSGKEVYLTDSFEGDIQFMKIILGYMGAFSNQGELDKSISTIIIGNNLLESYYNGSESEFIKDLEEKLNLNSSPYRRMQIISEDQFIWYLENRDKTNPNSQIMDYLKQYKSSKKHQGNLFSE